MLRATALPSTGSAKVLLDPSGSVIVGIGVGLGVGGSDALFFAGAL
jgi:hypothetical protein